jgi:hypothetical protein
VYLNRSFEVHILCHDVQHARYEDHFVEASVYERLAIMAILADYSSDSDSDEHAPSMLVSSTSMDLDPGPTLSTPSPSTTSDASAPVSGFTKNVPSTAPPAPGPTKSESLDDIFSAHQNWQKVLPFGRVSKVVIVANINALSVLGRGLAFMQ